VASRAVSFVRSAQAADTGVGATTSFERNKENEYGIRVTQAESYSLIFYKSLKRNM
jgi:hypothetical protein